MSASLPEGHEPSNAEILAALKRISDDIQSNHQARQLGHLAQRQSELEQEIKAVGKQARKALDSQSELESIVLHEVGLQAKKIDSLTEETERQSNALANQDAKLSELIDDKKTVMAMLKTLRYIGIIAPIILGALLWLIQHSK